MIILRHLTTMLGLAALLTALAACGSPEDPSSLVEIAPLSPEVWPGESVAFAVSVAGTSDETVQWSVLEEGGGTIDAAGNYTAPDSEGTFTVQTSISSLSTTQKTAVRVNRNIRVNISPSSATLLPGESLALTASVSGPAKDVTWSIHEGAGGTITAAGVYTAPQAEGTYTVIATSAADSSKSNLATITVTTTSPPSSPSPSEPTGVTPTPSDPIPTPTPTPVTVPTPTPSGTQFYVATNGNDANPGTITQPWRTIQKAMNSATPGSTVNIRGGTYNERLVLAVSGTPTQRITFQNYGFAPANTAPGSGALGESVILDYAYLGTITDTIPLLRITDRSYVTIQGLTFRNANYNGGGPQWGWRIHGAGTTGIHMKHNKLINLIEVEAAATAMQAAIIHGGANGNWFYSNEFGNIRPNLSEVVTVAGAPNNLIEKNYFRDTYNIALGLFVGPNYPGNGSGNVARGNLFEYIGFTRSGGQLTSAAYPSGSSAIYVDGGYDAIIEGNTIRNSSFGVNVDAESGNSWAARNIVIRNNVIYRDATFNTPTDLVGIKVGTFYSSTDGTRISNVDILNNTIDGMWYGLMVRPYQSSTVRWHNNSVTNSVHRGLLNQANWPVGNMSNNLWFNNPAGTNGSGTGDVLSNPGYANPAAGNFAISAGSPALNRGHGATANSSGFYSSTSMNAGTFHHGGAPRFVGTIDIGAYEAP